MNKKIFLTLILAFVLCISCFASVVCAADDSALSATVTTTNNNDGTITVTVTPTKTIKTGILKLTYGADVECTTPDSKKGAVRITDKDGYVNIGFFQNTSAEPVVLTFKAKTAESVGKEATFTVSTREGDDYTLSDGTVLVAGEDVTISKSDSATVPAPVEITPSVPAPTGEVTPSTPGTTNETTPSVPATTNEATPTTPAETGDETSADGPMPQTGANVLAISAVVLAIVAAGYVAKKTLAK